MNIYENIYQVIKYNTWLHICFLNLKENVLLTIFYKIQLRFNNISNVK